MIGLTILLVYSLSLLGLVGYGLHRGWLVLSLRRGGPPLYDRMGGGRESLPSVTVQLPVYNERFVVERLIDAACDLDYPRSLLEVQVLDDSSDDTSELARARVEHHRGRGVAIDHIRRPARRGYKAGALAYGLRRARGELVLILDADFLPPRDTIRRLLPAFSDPRVGMAQARWGFLNEGVSWLTRVQALLLDAHFHIEHAARQAAGLFFNFNGTGGMWRADCIRDAGGWRSDTLTEDLDLSYRAQMRGWRFAYVPDLVVPGELPARMGAFKSQQARWAQGSIQTARKLLPELLSGDWRRAIKLEAIAHLTSYVPSLLTLAVGLLVFPATLVRLRYGSPALLLVDLACFAAAIAPITLFYAATLRAAGKAIWPALLRAVPLVLALGVGVSVNNSRAVLAGLSGRGRNEFVRTPKRGSAGSGYRPRFSRSQAVVELVVAAYAGLAVAYAVVNGLYASVPFLCLFLGGFTVVAAASVLDAEGLRASAPGVRR